MCTSSASNTAEHWQRTCLCHGNSFILRSYCFIWSRPESALLTLQIKEGETSGAVESIHLCMFTIVCAVSGLSLLDFSSLCILYFIIYTEKSTTSQLRQQLSSQKLITNHFRFALRCFKTSNATLSWCKSGTSESFSLPFDSTITLKSNSTWTPHQHPPTSSLQPLTRHI